MFGNIILDYDLNAHESFVSFERKKVKTFRLSYFFL